AGSARGPVGAAVVPARVGAPVRGAFTAAGSAGRAVSAAVVATGVGPAVAGAFTPGGPVGAAVPATEVRAAVRRAFAHAAHTGLVADVAVVDRHKFLLASSTPYGPKSHASQWAHNGT